MHRDLESNELPKRELKSLAKNATFLRSIFVDRAKDFTRSQRVISLESFHEVRKAGQKIRNRGSGKPVDDDDIKASELIEIPPISHRKKCRTNKKLQLSEKIQIAHRVLIKEVPLRQVAKEFRIAQSYVSRIVLKVRKKPEVLEELVEERNVREEETERISSSIVEMYM